MEEKGDGVLLNESCMAVLSSKGIDLCGEGGTDQPQKVEQA